MHRLGKKRNAKATTIRLKNRFNKNINQAIEKDWRVWLSIETRK